MSDGHGFPARREMTTVITTGGLIAAGQSVGAQAVTWDPQARPFPSGPSCLLESAHNAGFWARALEHLATVAHEHGVSVEDL
jgi:hypothetical protein